MRKLLLSAALLASLTTYAADTTPVWCDPSVNQQNREPRRADFFAFENIDKAKGDKSASARYQSMEGMWKFCFVGCAEEFLRTEVRRLQVGGFPRTRTLRTEWIWRQNLQEYRLCLEHDLRNESAIYR